VNRTPRWFAGAGTGDVSVEAANQPVTRLGAVLERQWPSIDGGPKRPGVGTDTDRSGRSSLSYTNSNRKIPARRSSVDDDRFKPG
jgi:hypothetical protein